MWVLSGLIIKMSSLKNIFLKLNFSSKQIKDVSEYCEKIYPEEACGLLIGKRLPAEDLSSVTVHDIIFTKNISRHPRQKFEIDPVTLFKVMKDLRGTGDTIIGHFHSHPDHPAVASETDEKMIYDHRLYWVILSVVEGKTVELAQYHPHQEDDYFIELERMKIS